MGNISADELTTTLDRDGFVRICNALPAQDLKDLRAACHRSASLARSGKWPYVRTIPKQFPPWNNDIGNGIWGVQHLLHPDMNDATIFQRSYFNDTVISSVTALLHCSELDLVMELYNLLLRPDKDFALRWHRDDIPPSTSGKEEQACLSEPVLHAQWNLALYEDESLIVLPGSHKRARTAAERNADPFEADVPGQQVASMKAGDVVFYNNNILHRGVYSSNVERMTLHGSMGVTGADPARARNILQHGIGQWAGECDFSDLPGSMAEQAKNMKQRLIAMGSGDDVGYSQSDT